MTLTGKRLLLVDADDSRRDTRISLLESAGYLVDVRADHVAAERLDHEGEFDLIIVALHQHPEATTAYSDHLIRYKPRLPVLLLTDLGVFVPPGTLSGSIDAGNPATLLQEVAVMLAGSTHVRELPVPRA